MKECLLVEDDRDDQEIFQLALAHISLPATCTIAESGKEALTILKSNDSYIPDIIFIDVNMPIMNGMECLREIKQLPHLKTTRIYMYSTSADVYPLNDEALKPDDFIVKPPSLTELTKILSLIFEGLS